MNNREFLKEFMRGCEDLTDIGISIHMWLIMGDGICDKETVEACRNALQWHKRVYGVADRESGFYDYLDKGVR